MQLNISKKKMKAPEKWQHSESKLLCADSSLSVLRSFFKPDPRMDLKHRRSMSITLKGLENQRLCFYDDEYMYGIYLTFEAFSSVQWQTLQHYSITFVEITVTPWQQRNLKIEFFCEGRVKKGVHTRSSIFL